MKKIAFIVNSLGVGGAEKHTITLANRLSVLGYSITIFVLKKNNDLLDEVDSKIKIKFLNINKFYNKDTVNLINKECHDIGIEEIFCVNSYPLLYGYNAVKNTNIKCTIIHHTTELIGIKNKIKNIYLKKLMNKCNKRIFVSSNQRKYWIQKYDICHENSYVIRNGVDVKKFTNLNNNLEVKKQLGITSKDLVITCSAMLRPEKNHIQLLKYIKELVNNGNSNVKLLLLGDGQERNSIEKYILENKLKDNVILLGKQKDVKKYYSISDLGVIASKAVETFSIAALEQMSMGIPMIMTNIGGANEMVIDGFNGYLYELDDHLTFIKKIKELNEDREKLERLKINARFLVENTFSEQMMINEYVSFLEE